MKRDKRDFPRTLLSLAYGFGTDLAAHFRKSPQDLIDFHGHEKARIIVVTITLDENFLFCLFWVLYKLSKKYQTNNITEIVKESGIDIAELISFYEDTANNDERRKHIFNPEIFRKLSQQRLSEYFKLSSKHEVYAISHFLEVMSRSIAYLEYQIDFPIIENVKINLYAIDDIKWLNEKVEELIEDYFTF
jgi:hypothetical protein